MILWDSIVGGLLNKVAPKVADYYIQKADAQHRYRIAKLDAKAEKFRHQIARASESEGRDHEWELESIRNSGHKDEWILFLLSIPLVLVFVPFYQPYILEGFGVLEQTPEWYRWLVIMIFAAVYGIRVWRRK